MNWPTNVPLIADKSAWARMHLCADRWRAALDRDHIVLCEIVRLELLFSGRNREEVRALDADLDTLRDLPVTRNELRSARGAMLRLAEAGSDGYHRVPPTDAIIAACAAEHGCAVLHYDAHFDRLAEVLPFTSVWLVPTGSAER